MCLRLHLSPMLHLPKIQLLQISDFRSFLPSLFGLEADGERVFFLSALALLAGDAAGDARLGAWGGPLFIGQCRFMCPNSCISDMANPCKDIYLDGALYHKYGTSWASCCHASWNAGAQCRRVRIGQIVQID